MDQNKLLRQVEEKYQVQGVDQETYLRGLLQLKPLTYWDYVEVDTLLSLQKPRTDFKDEEVFILYHQMTELMLKLMLHEIRQMVKEDLSEQELVTKLKRINNYTGVLITCFGMMKDGISYDDYNIFRCALAPASGFQSAQFRYIELYCTSLSNLVSDVSRLPPAPAVEDYFAHIYWRAAGINNDTRKKTLTLKLFEEKYLGEFISLAKEVQGNTLEDKIRRIAMPGEELVSALRQFDFLYNVKLPLTHLETARHFLSRKGETKEATGGSKWTKYLHPASQKRRFFPHLWGIEELGAWGAETAGHEAFRAAHEDVAR